MCKSQAEGGQRCAGHARERVAKAQKRFDKGGSGEDLQRLLTAETDLASTPDGHAEAVRKATAGEPGPGGLPADRWVRIADDGEALRERNALIAGAAKEQAQTEREANKIPDQAEVLAHLPRLVRDYTPVQHEACVEWLSRLPLEDLRQRQSVMNEQIGMAFEQAQRPGNARGEEALQECQDRSAQLVEAVMRWLDRKESSKPR